MASASNENSNLEFWTFWSILHYYPKFYSTNAMDTSDHITQKIYKLFTELQ